MILWCLLVLLVHLWFFLYGDEGMSHLQDQRSNEKSIFKLLYHQKLPVPLAVKIKIN